MHRDISIKNITFLGGCIEAASFHISDDILNATWPLDQDTSETIKHETPARQMSQEIKALLQRLDVTNKCTAMLSGSDTAVYWKPHPEIDPKSLSIRFHIFRLSDSLTWHPSGRTWLHVIWCSTCHDDWTGLYSIYKGRHPLFLVAHVSGRYLQPCEQAALLANRGKVAGDASRRDDALEVTSGC